MERRLLLKSLAALAAIPAQMQQTARGVAPERRRVVPLDVIKKFDLKPRPNGFGAFVLGEDGNPYDFDDVIAVIFEMTKDHWQIRK